MADPAPAHLRRDAYIYVRQSTLAQTVRNTESLLRQYDLAGRARQLGWAEHQIVVVDDDLGRSGASAQGRKGFSDLVADVGLGKAGIVLSLESSRLARNNALFRYRNKAFCSAHGFMPRAGRQLGVERYGYSPIWRAGLILALCETDRWTDAADQMVAFAEDTERFGAFPPSGWAVPTLALLAEACSVLGRSVRHQPRVAELAPLIDGALAGHHAEIALAGWPTVLIGPVARARGLLALAVGEGPLALERFGYAARLSGTSRPQMARLRADRARVLLGHPALGSEGEAAALLADSLSAAQDLGMARLADDVRALQAGSAPDQASTS